MATYNGSFTRPINAYHRNTSLLLQFILVEFMTSYEECQKLAGLCHLKPMPLPPASDLPPDYSALQHQIGLSLTRLVGTPPGAERLVAWNFGEGLLAKLKAYCMLFAQQSERDEKELLGMQHYTDKAWQSGLQAQAHFAALEEARPQLLAALDKMFQSMQRLAKHVARVVALFRDDENIVFFVLRHHKRFENLYPPRFISKLLARMFPKGSRELKQFLHAKYAERGFTNMLPSIDTQIAELEAATL